MKDEIEMVEPKFISVDPSKCVGCSICEYACSLEKEWSFNPSRSRIRVMRLHPLFCLTMVCRFCEDAPCVLVCPRKALKQSPDGIVIVDEDLCDGCGWCLSSCKYGAITVNPEKNVVMICDLCDGEPKCIEMCPEDALELLTEEEANRKTAERVKETLSEVKEVSEKIEDGNWREVFSDFEEKLLRLENKLVELNKKELEIFEKAQEMFEAEEES